MAADAAVACHCDKSKCFWQVITSQGRHSECAVYLVWWWDKTYTIHNTGGKAQHPATPKHPSHTTTHTVAPQRQITTRNVTPEHPSTLPMLLANKKSVLHFYKRVKESSNTWLCLCSVKRSQKETEFWNLMQHLEHKCKEELMSIQRKVLCSRTPY